MLIAIKFLVIAINMHIWGWRRIWIGLIAINKWLDREPLIKFCSLTWADRDQDRGWSRSEAVFRLKFHFDVLSEFGAFGTVGLGSKVCLGDSKSIWGVYCSWFWCESIIVVTRSFGVLKRVWSRFVDLQGWGKENTGSEPDSYNTGA